MKVFGSFTLFLLCLTTILHAQKTPSTAKKQINSYGELFVEGSASTSTKSSKGSAKGSSKIVDSVLLNEAELIDQFFEEGKHKSPSYIWYRNDFCNSKVRLCDNRSLDSIPDEIIIQLVKKGENPFTFPIKKKKTSNYGWRWNRPHRGVDIGLNTGDPVHCCFDGVVRVAKPLGNYGNLVVVRHYNGLETVYGHLSKINVKPLQIIKSGDTIGLGGSTGRSTGPHLHFEVRFQYEAFDPEWILNFDNYALQSNRLYLDKSYFGIEAPSKTNKQYYSFVEDEKEKKNMPLYAEQTSTTTQVLRKKSYSKGSDPSNYKTFKKSKL